MWILDEMKATKIHLSFKLTMPNRGSWNSQWTGDGKFYFRGKSVDSEDLPRIMGKVDKNGSPIIIKRTWSTRPTEQRRIIKGFDNLILINDNQ